MKKGIWLVAILAISLFTLNTHASELDVRHAWVRLPPPVSNTAAVYAQFHNPGSKDVHIVGVSADLGSSAMIHSMVGGTMKALSKLTVPAGGHVDLAPGKLHIMIMGLKHLLLTGERVGIELHYADGSHQRFEAVVRDMRQDSGGMRNMNNSE